MLSFDTEVDGDTIAEVDGDTMMTALAPPSSCSQSLVAEALFIPVRENRQIHYALS